MQLSTLTALDMLGVRPTLQADGTYRHACTVCGAAAVTTRYQTSCSDKQCRLQAAAPLDLIALKAGSYAAAARWVNTERRNDDAVSRREAEDRRRHRRILDTWLDLCSTEPVTVSHARVTGKLLADGMRLLPGQRGMVSLTEISLRRLADLAKETGAEYPDSLDIHVPPAALAFVVQTHPCRVDRIVLCHGRNSVTQIIWDRRSVGIIGLIGAGGRRYVAADYRAALELQERFYNVGRPQ
jgi:hypothetical protein